MARFIALDWDHHQLHVVAANISGSSVRIQKAVVWQEERSPNPIEPEALGQLLKERLKSAGIAPAPILACVGRDRVILKEVRYPSVPPYEEPAIVRFQALKELNDPPEEIILDYAPNGVAGNGEKRALALAVRREMLISYNGLAKGAGVKLLAITPRPFAAMAGLKRLMGASVLTPAPEPADAPVALLTLTDRWAEFSIVRGDALLFARNCSVGAGLPGEIKRNLSVHAGQSPQATVKALYVAGLGEHAALRERLQELTGIPVHAFDPFGGAENPDLPANSRGSFAGAVGLLYAQAEKRELPINFAKPKQPKPPRDPSKRRLVFVGAFAAALLIGAISYCYTTLSAKDAEIERLFLEQQNLDKRLVALDEDAKRIKAVEEWVNSSIVWLDEIYDLVDRFPDTESIRLVTLTGDPNPKGAKDKHVGKLALKGITTDDHAVDMLIAQVVQDAHYRADPKQLTNNQLVDRQLFRQSFQTKIDIEKLPPNKFVRRLPERSEDEEPERGKGREKGRRPQGPGARGGQE